MLTINPRDAVPIWKQIESEIRRLVATGTLVPGNPVPSVRELAQELRVNPATISKAFQRLTDEGLLSVRRGEGTFVADRPPAVRRSVRHEALASEAMKYVSLAATIGASEEEALGEIRAAFETIEGGERRRKS